MFRDEIGDSLRRRFGENVRWCLASVVVAADVSVAVQDGDVEGRRAYPSAAHARGAAVRSALYRQRGLLAGHRHRARGRLRSSSHPPHEECGRVYHQM